MNVSSTMRDPGSLWHMGNGKGLFAGPLYRNTLHAHSASVFLAGLYGTFGLRIEGEQWMSCRAAAIPAGVAYEFDLGGDPLGVLYLEPSIAGAEALMPLVRNTREVGGTVLGTAGEFSVLRELYEGGTTMQWCDLALDDVLSYGKPRARREIDPRVSRIVAAMSNAPGKLVPVEQYASSVGLSASRFQHLFTQQVGVPFRRYRAWHRLRTAIGEIVKGSNFTQAAHAAGFHDQAHFSHDFRRTFGARPSASLKRLRR